jgi:hypothetical protein
LASGGMTITQCVLPCLCRVISCAENAFKQNKSSVAHNVASMGALLDFWEDLKNHFL